MNNQKKGQEKKFLKFCKCEYASIYIMFLVAVYIWTIVDTIFSHSPLHGSIILVLILSVISSGLYIGVYYARNKDYFDCLYNIVCLNWKTGNRYENFENIRKELFLYKYNGKIDVFKNAEVIKAFAERDNALYIFYTAFATILGALAGFIVNSDMFDDFTSFNVIYLYLCVVLAYILIGREIPKIYFIQSVAKSVESELDSAKEHAEKIERNKEILDLYQSGMSYKKIGKIYDISAQAVEQACLNANCPQEKLFLYIGKNKYIYEYLTEKGINSIEKFKMTIQYSKQTLDEEVVKYVDSIVGESKGSGGYQHHIQ